MRRPLFITLLLLPALVTAQTKVYDFDAAKAHKHKKSVTVEAVIVARDFADTKEGSVKPDEWDESVRGPYIKGTPYFMGNVLRLRRDDRSEFSVYFILDDPVLVGRIDREEFRVSVTYDSVCGWASRVEVLAPCRGKKCR